MEFTTSDYIAMYAAVVSTVVLFIQIAEKIKNHYRIEVSLNTDDARYESNKLNIKNLREGANKRGNSSRLTQSFHFFMFEPFFLP